MEQQILKNVTINPKIISTAKGNIEYDLTDKDASVILGCHGGIGGVDQSRLLIDFAKNDFRLLSISRPGYLGTPIESGKSPEEQADLFAATLDALNIKKVAVLCASFGGPFGFVFAKKYPDRVWALLACDAVSGHYEIPETAGPITQAIFLSNIGQKLLQGLNKISPDAFIKKFFMTEAYFTKNQLKEHIDFVNNTPDVKEWVTAFMNTIYPYDTRKVGTDNDQDVVVKKQGHYPDKNITVPTLIVHGTHDSDAKFYDGVFAYESIPNAERIWIEEGSHICFWTHPKSKEYQQQALAFLKRNKPEKE